jgi:hypothetical protein
MHMIVVVMPFFATAPANGISGRPIRSRDRMDDTFFSKGLQGSVNGNPVEALQRMFNIAVPQGTGIMVQKKIENVAAAIRHTQVVLSQYIRYLVFHVDGCCL